MLSWVKATVSWKFDHCSACTWNMMNNYTWTLIIWWKRKIFIYFIKCYWIKDLLSTVIQNKKYLVVFHKHKINSLHVYYLISCVIFGLFIFFLSLCKIEYFGTLANISFNMFWNFLSIICIFKNVKLCFVSMKKKTEQFKPLHLFFLPDRQFNNVATYIISMC